MKLYPFFCAAALAVATPARATTPPPAPAAVDSAALRQARIDSLNNVFHYVTGKVLLPGNLGTLTVPAGMRFLDSAQAHRVLIGLWGNPPASAATTLGMLFPAKAGPVSDDSWAFVVDYEPVGYVKDEDADEIDYNELLTEMQQDTRDNNAERQKQGYAPIELLGWASPPYYDKQTHTLHWAKTLRFGDTDTTMNYDVRVLGRKGVMSLMAVGSPHLLPAIKPHVPALIQNVTFADGLAYGDFNPDVDEIAAYSIGGLVAGKVLAKAGFFAVVLKFWKVLFAALLAGVSALRRFFTGRKDDETATS